MKYAHLQAFRFHILIDSKKLGNFQSEFQLLRAALRGLRLTSMSGCQVVGKMRMSACLAPLNHPRPTHDPLQIKRRRRCADGVSCRGQD